MDGTEDVEPCCPLATTDNPARQPVFDPVEPIDHAQQQRRPILPSVEPA
jgi:hypothetical protein